MKNNKEYKSIRWRTRNRKLQRILDNLLEEIRANCRETNIDIVWLVKESQQRLMTYKELNLHRAVIDERELIEAFSNLSVVEKQLIKLGEDTLTEIILELDGEL
ncbi:hypothetical protein [Vibrio rotiferianus]|jgi:transcriptional regulator CtsR|uniref:hypothetical protein n=1 Tax=Vibrio rotiferianus TaxID=190895 RepID=UPI00406AA2CF